MRDWIDNQYQNRFLYVPFLLAFGAALYFSLPYEPSVPLAPFVLIVLLALLFVRRVPDLVRAILIFLIGFCYAYMFTGFIDTPHLSHNMNDVDIVGTVKSVDYTATKTRIYLRVNASDIKISDSDTAIVRLSLSDGVNIPSAGDIVRVNMGVFNPSPAYSPGAFDYARWAYFNKLTAIGYASDIRVIERGDNVTVNNLRWHLHEVSNSFLVDSLVLGFKAAVPTAETSVWTASGIGHVWSISGFHMTLVGGWIFILFFCMFRCVPYITRRIPARIPAMVCAWLGLLFYLFLSGVDIATVRAFIMTTLIFAAFIFGRSAISMRNIALAFIFIFVLNPHYVMQAGFQLSFAAVFGLVWLYSCVRPTMPNNKILRIIYACILTSVIATVFTAPFVAMHFDTIPLYGLIGNLILLPVFSFVIMPLVLLGVILSIFGVYFPINLAHHAYDITFSVATYISELPYAVLSVSNISNYAIVCFIVGFMSLILIRPIRVKINYILCAVFSIVGICIVCVLPRPVFYSSYDNELVAFVRDDGLLEFNKSRASKHFFAFDTWKQINGQSLDTPNHRRKHDSGVYRYGDIVYIQKFVPLMKNIKSLCADDDVRYIVSYFDIKSELCSHKILRGGFVIYPDGHVKHTITNRRWH